MAGLSKSLKIAEKDGVVGGKFYMCSKVRDLLGPPWSWEHGCSKHFKFRCCVIFCFVLLGFFSKCVFTKGIILDGTDVRTCISKVQLNLNVRFHDVRLQCCSLWKRDKDF